MESEERVSSPALLTATLVGEAATPSPEPVLNHDNLQEISAQDVDTIIKSPSRSKGSAKKQHSDKQTKKGDGDCPKEQDSAIEATCMISASADDVIFQKIETVDDVCLSSSASTDESTKSKQFHGLASSLPPRCSEANASMTSLASSTKSQPDNSLSDVTVGLQEIDLGADADMPVANMAPSMASSSNTGAFTSEDESDVLLSESELSDQLASNNVNGLTKSTQNVIALKRKIAALESELDECKGELSSTKTRHQQQISQMQSDWLAKNEKLLNQVESAVKERETMVMKYASCEYQVIVAQKAREQAEQKLGAAMKERDQYFARVKTLLNEKTRLCSSLDNRLADMSRMQREFENLRAEIVNRDGLFKQLQDRLDAEVEAHKETKSLVASYIAQLEEKTNELEKIQESSKHIQEETAKETSESEFARFQSQLDELRQKLNDASSENTALTRKIQALERERLEFEDSQSRLKETHREQLQQVEAECRQKIQELKEFNDDLREEAESCRRKESEMLDFTEKLTARTVDLQSEKSLLESRVQHLSEEQVSLKSSLSKMEARCSQLESDLEKEKALRKKETETLAKKLAESIKHAESLAVKVEEAQNESKVFKRRHLSSVKELSRELVQAKKRLEAFEQQQQQQGGGANSNATNSPLNGGNAISDTASCSSDADLQPTVSFVQTPTSLIRGTASPKRNSASSVVLFSKRNNGAKYMSVPTKSSSPSNARNIPKSSSGEAAVNSGTSSPFADVDKQMLVERIVKLQKNLARKNDKIEFLEEHVRELLLEIRKKSRIIQNFVMKEESGALTSNSSDRSKRGSSRRNDRAELAKRGRGIMASMYSSQPSDGALTLELSLEINRKLQAVLEDTLLKNITLKESVNTLGDEIARLSSASKKEVSTENNNTS